MPNSFADTDGAIIPYVALRGPDVVDVTLVADTLILADGDIIGTTVAITGAIRNAGGAIELRSVQVNDADDQGVAMDLVFFDANASLGTANSAPSISDADAVNIIGWVNVPSANYKDFGGVRKAIVTNIGLVLKATAASKALYVSAISRGGTPTYTAGGLTLKLGFNKE